jgi:hypothetical protein
MAQIENWNAELRSWLFPVLYMLSHKAERRGRDKPLPRAAGPVTIQLPAEVREQLEIEAAKRGMTIAELCGKLVYVAAQDGLVGAVLDDAVA